MKSNWWNKIYTPIILALVLVIGMSIGRHFLADNIYTINSNSSKLDRILQYIEDDYVDSLDYQQIQDKAIEEMISQLDPHSAYIVPEDFHAYTDPLVGNFEGIGIQFRMIRDSLTVMLPLAGGPSQKAGIEAGDKIVIADDDTIANRKMNSEDIIKKLKGESGSRVQLKIYRSGADSLLSFDVVRDRIPTYSLDAMFMVKNHIGYIKISKFSATTIEEFHDAIEKLLSQGMEKLILDLRGNSGGYLRAAIAMADTFLEDGKLIVYTKGKNRPEKRYYANAHGAFEKQDFVILIDENSASASEIVAGAIQDNDRGLIIGRKSFGKGLVQEQMNFADGSALRLTVARYYTPTGRCIQRPYDKGTEAYYSDHYHQVMNELKAKPDSTQKTDTLKFTTPAGKIVYGGGGITPDIHIPIDTSVNYYFYNRLYKQSIISEMAIDYFNHHKKQLQSYIDAQDFYGHFKMKKQYYQEIVKRGEKQDILPTIDAVKNSKEIVGNAFMAELARLLFYEEGYYYVYLQKDQVFNKSLKILDTEGK
jgi:carboxyl-terminal processing protease